LHSFATPAFGVERETLRGHVPEPVAKLRLQPLGRFPATNRLNLAIGLPLRHTNELSQLLHDLYDPSSPRFRKYLTPEQFAEQFGPTREEYEAVRQFAQTHGLEVTATHPNRLLLDVAGQAQDIEKALQFTLSTYQHPTEARTFYAPDAEPSVEKGLAVLAINGLDDFVLPHPMNLRKSPKERVKGSALPTGSGPEGAYLGNDFRAAYVPGVSLTGAGQLVGLLEFDGYYPGDIEAYEAKAGLPEVPLFNVLLDGFDGGAYGGNSEVALDIEMVISMAPGLSGIIVYEGSLAQDMLNNMANDNQAKQLSSSWGWRPYDPNSEQIFQQFAAQGQSYFNSSGDGDAWVGGIPWAPMDDPYVTIVGGTSLTTSGPGGPWVSEAVWNWGQGVGSSGGVSTNYDLPSWQQGFDMSANQGSSTHRNIPDVAMVADNVFVIADGGQEENLGGTSCATPLWAALTALVNEQSVTAGSNTVGFLNPALYALGKGGHYTYAFHDITAGNNKWAGSPNEFSAVPGYDLCTGLGTPQGASLIDALAPPDVLVVWPDNPSIWTSYMGVPVPGSGQPFTLTNAGGASFNWRAGISSAWLNISPASGTLAPGGGETLVRISEGNSATKLPVGTYTSSVWFTNLSDQVVQSRQFTLEVLDDLQILPAEGLSFNRAAARTFLMTNQNIMLTNIGRSVLNWAVVSTSAWFNVTPDSGAIASGNSTPVSVSLAPIALSLGLGTVSNTLWFINLGDLQVQTYPVTIAVQPLLINGGFETGDFTGWSVSGDIYGLFVMPSRNYNYAHSGNCAAAFGSPYTPGFLSQTVQTIPGAHYTISFWLLSPDGQTPNQFEVVWEGQRLYDTINLPRRGWTKLQFPVSAASTSTTLQFGGRDSPSLLALDDVRLDLEPLLITPNTGFVCTGYVGGPFSFTNQTFTLTNLGGGLLSWGLTNSSAWLNVSSGGGVLSPGSSVAVAIGLSAGAAGLPVGHYTDTVWVTNLSAGSVQSLQFALQVQPSPEPLQIMPDSLVFSRRTGGFFGPARLSLDLTNVGPATLSWSLASASALVVAQPANGALSPGGGATPVTVALDGAAANLPPGNYTNTIWFTNLSDSTVQSAQVILLTLPIVQNGDFETGDVSFWTETGDTSYCVVGTLGLYVHSGNYGASMGPQGTRSYLSQVLPTTDGQLYLLSFWLDSPDGLAPNEFSTAWNGSTLFDQLNLRAFGWTNFQYLVTAAGPSTMIQFGFRNDQSYFGFDDVSVQPVAMPAFQSVVRASSALSLGWSTQPGLRYQLQYATRLIPPDWTNLGNVISATSDVITFSDPILPGGDAMRMYRVLLLP
jgi:hypothetical protein